MRRLALLFLCVSMAGCRCGGGAVTSRFGELVVVQQGATGREVLLREATVPVAPVVMESVGAGTVPVRNVGLEDIVIGSVTRLEGDSELSLDDAVGLSIAPEADATLPIRFAPPQAADATSTDVVYRATFAVQLTGARPGEEVLTLTLVATAVARDCFVPALIDFGLVPLQQAVVKPLLLENGRALAADTTFEAPSGADATAFFIDAASPFTIAAGASAALPVRFSPLEPRRYEASVVMQRAPQCPSARVDLRGEGSDQALTWSPARLDFGRIPLGNGVTKSVTVVNNSTVALSLVPLLAAGDFRVEAGAPDVVPARGQATVRVTCTPSALGPLSGLLQLDLGTVPVTPARLPLTCVGGGPRIRIDPSPLLFGVVPMSSSGSAVTKRRIIVQNVGTAPPAPSDPANNLVLGQPGGAVPWFSIVPKNFVTTPQEFSVALRSTYDNTVGLPAIAGSNFAEFEVSIAPLSTGLREAELLVYSNDALEPVARVQISAVPRLPESCTLAITPSGADFGATPRGAVVNRLVTLNNTGNSTCLISGIEMAPGSDLAFQVADPLISGVLINAGQARTVRVQATVPGTAAVGDYLRGTLRMTVSGEGMPRAVPVDLKVSQCLVVDPPLLDLGLVQLGCSSAARPVTLYNVCGLPITITGSSGPALPFRITSSPLGTGPLTLDPATQFTVLVAAAPASIGSFSGVLRFDSLEGNTPNSQGVGLRVQADTAGFVQDTFTQGATDVDILLVIDNSCSMGDEQAALATNFSAFISSAVQSSANWHIGVTTTDLPRDKGALVRSATNPAVLTPTTPNVAALFAQKVQLGTAGSGLEQPFAAMAQAVTEPNKSGANAGFLRQNAALAVVVVTDALEQSANSVGSYLATMRSAKANRPELLSISVVGPFTLPGMNCVTEGAVDDGRFQAAITGTSGVRADICTSNWAMDLQSISRSVFAARRGFVLSSTARSAADITVTLDGTAIPSSAWRYDGADNAIVFNSAPATGTQVAITYRTACF